MRKRERERGCGEGWKLFMHSDPSRHIHNHFLIIHPIGASEEADAAPILSLSAKTLIIHTSPLHRAHFLSALAPTFTFLLRKIRIIA